MGRHTLQFQMDEVLEVLEMLDALGASDTADAVLDATSSVS